MKKRLIAITITMLLMVSMIPGIAFAAPVTTALSTNQAKIGTSVTASGTADPNEWVAVKILDSAQNIVFFDSVKADGNGNYSCTFKVPEVSKGTLKVIAGYGNNIARQSLEVTGGSSGGPGGVGGTINTGTTVNASQGATINVSGASIVIPANATSSDIKVQVEKVSNIAALPTPAKSKIVSDVLEITKNKTENFTKPVTITLTFNPSQVDTSKYDIGIYWLDTATNEWVKLDNIVVDIATGTVSGEVSHFTKFAVIASEKETATIPPTPPVINLNDISGHWAEASIKLLVNAGAVAGYPDNSFKPDNNITRAEFATILVKAFKLQPQNGKVFADTANHWAKDYIATANANRIINGYSDTLFGPDDFITREQMAVMIVNAARLSSTSAGKTFADSALISDWAREAVDKASANGIISGYADNTFRPHANATRAEAVTVIAKGL
ncbi:MAG: S-layer homology domain-containing protein [Syntrophomonadaceae bacterium]|jgi:hypothetical protein